MHLARLELTNVRGIEHEVFEFQPGINVIAGINGAGKSSILRSIQVVLKQAFASRGDARALNLNFKIDDIHRDRPEGMRINAELPHPEFGKLMVEYSLHGRGIRGLYGNKILPELARREVRRPLVLFFGPNESACPHLFKDSQATSWREQMEEIVRRMPAGRQIFGNMEPQYELFLRALKDFSADFNWVNWFLEPSTIRVSSIDRSPAGTPRENIHINNFKRNLRAALQRYFKDRPLEIPNSAPHRLRILPDGNVIGLGDNRPIHPLAFIYQQYVGTDPDPELLRLVRVDVVLKAKILLRKAEVALDLESFSDGEQRIFSIIFDIVRNLVLENPEERNPLERGRAIVVIDEVDSHLHPKWQGSVLDRLSALFPNCQFIVTTHSPFVIQSLRTDSLITLPRNSDAEEYAGKSIEDIAENVMGIRLPQKSRRYYEMLKVAENYYRTLELLPSAQADEISSLKEALDEALVPYEDDAAYVAFLRFQREFKLRENAPN